jgi:hypothetical protein
LVDPSEHPQPYVPRSKPADRPRRLVPKYALSKSHPFALDALDEECEGPFSLARRDITVSLRLPSPPYGRLGDGILKDFVAEAVVTAFSLSPKGEAPRAGVSGYDDASHVRFGAPSHPRKAGPLPRIDVPKGSGPPG